MKVDGSSGLPQRWRGRAKPTAPATMVLASGRLLTYDAKSVSKTATELASLVSGEGKTGPSLVMPVKPAA